MDRRMFSFWELLRLEDTLKTDIQINREQIKGGELSPGMECLYRIEVTRLAKELYKTQKYIGKRIKFYISLTNKERD